MCQATQRTPASVARSFRILVGTSQGHDQRPRQLTLSTSPSDPASRAAQMQLILDAAQAGEVSDAWCARGKGAEVWDGIDFDPCFRLRCVAQTPTRRWTLTDGRRVHAESSTESSHSSSSPSPHRTSSSGFFLSPAAPSLARPSSTNSYQPSTRPLEGQPARARSHKPNLAFCEKLRRSRVQTGTTRRRRRSCSATMRSQMLLRRILRRKRPVGLGSRSPRGRSGDAKRTS